MRQTRTKALQAALILEPLPSVLRNEMLRDAGFCAALGIRPKYTFSLDDHRRVETSNLHNILRGAIAGRTSSRLKLSSGKVVRVKLSVRKAGVVSVEFGKRGFLFADADLISDDAAKRSKALKRVLANRLLSPADQVRWRKIGRKRAFTDREYMELMAALEETPEALAEQLRQRTSFNVEILIPSNPLYYEGLLAPLEHGANLSAFISDELGSARRRALKSHPNMALRRIALSGLSHALIPFDLLPFLKASSISELLSSEDPFSLLFGLELCGKSLVTSSDFSNLGRQFLEKLFSNREELERRCTIFSACAVITMVSLRRVAKLATAPLFWVRLAALSHAGILTHALARLGDAKGFFRRSVGTFGLEFEWYGVIDRRDAPRWQSDWISPEHIQAELVGRSINALNLVPKADRPQEWVELIDQAVRALDSQIVSAFFPGPMDDFTSSISADNLHPAFEQVLVALKSASTFSEVPGLAALAYTHGLPEGALTDVLRLFELSSGHGATADDNGLKTATLCAHIAACSRSEALAQAVISYCLRIVRVAPPERVSDVFPIICVACAAHVQDSKYRSLLGETAAKVASIVDNSELLSQLSDILDVMTRRDPLLIPTFRRAAAIARG